MVLVRSGLEVLRLVVCWFVVSGFGVVVVKVFGVGVGICCLIVCLLVCWFVWFVVLGVGVLGLGFGWFGQLAIGNNPFAIVH